jgi:hypothetical protein
VRCRGGACIPHDRLCLASTSDPFDPAVAGGPKLPASVKGGPYTIPGRLDLINCDMGGDGVGYHTGKHETKGGVGYRIDGTTAALSGCALVPSANADGSRALWLLATVLALVGLEARGRRRRR